MRMDKLPGHSGIPFPAGFMFLRMNLCRTSGENEVLLNLTKKSRRD